MNTSKLNLKQLKQLAKAWNVTPVGDKRKKQTWIDAIETKRQELTATTSQPTAKEKFPQELTSETLLTTKIGRAHV